MMKEIAYKETKKEKSASDEAINLMLVLLIPFVVVFAVLIIIFSQPKTIRNNGDDYLYLNFTGNIDDTFDVDWYKIEVYNDKIVVYSDAEITFYIKDIKFWGIDK